MKKLSALLVIGLLGLSAATTCHAQFVYPPDLVDKLQIDGIANWEIEKNDRAEYVAILDVRFVNESQYHVVFRDPDFDVFFELPTREELGAKSHVLKPQSGTEGDMYQVTQVPTRRIRFGKAIIERAQGQTHADLLVPAPTGTAKMQKTVEKFTIVLGPATVETADRLIEIFNAALNKNPKCTTLIVGETRVGIQGPSGRSTMFSKEPLDLEITQKPNVLVDVEF